MATATKSSSRKARTQHAMRASRLLQVKELQEPPYSLTAEQIAMKLGVSIATVWRAKAAIKNKGVGQPDPKTHEQIKDLDVRACLSYTVEGFRAFFNRYSGFELPAHAEEWIKYAIEEDRVLLNVPPRHAKTKIVTVWFSLWSIALDRNIQILIMSQTDKMARKFTNELTHHLEANDKLIRDFGRFKPYDDSSPWRPLQGEIMVEGRTRDTESGDLSVQIKGMGQQILGMEADLIIGDDIVDRKSAWSASERDHKSEIWHGDVMTRQAPVSKVIVIGQRIHHEDLYGEIAEKRFTVGERTGQPQFRHINYPAVNWDTQETLWPEVWPFEKIVERFEDLKRKGDNWLFEAMYQQNPIPSSERLVQPEWIYGDDSHIGCLDSYRRLGQADVPEDLRWVRAVSIDPSPERNAGIVVADVLADREQFSASILEAVRGRMDVRKMLDELERITRLYQPSYLVFEHNAFARWFMQDPRFQQWQRKNNVRVISHTTGRNKSDPDYGVQTLAMHFEFGRIRLPWGDRAAQEQSKALIEEATNYPFGAYNDLLMALWFLSWNHSRLIPPVDEKKRREQKATRGFRVPKRLEKGFSYQNRRRTA